ncbi:hypothetical protein K1Y78_25300 [Streptomyces sp. tea 10]|nr:hypothetical protein [Streptomyces sp. tea 10]
MNAVVGWVGVEEAGRSHPMSGRHSRSRKRSTAQRAPSRKSALAHSPQALSKGEILAATSPVGTLPVFDFQTPIPYRSGPSAPDG